MSVLNAAVSIPASCLPVSVIPGAYRSWFQAVLEEGKRVAPPEGLVELIVVTPAAVPVVVRVERSADGSGIVTLTEIREIDGRLLSYSAGAVLTTTRLYIPAQGVDIAVDSQAGRSLLATPKQRRVVLAGLDAGYQPSGLRKVLAVEIGRGGVERPVLSAVEADDLMALGDGRLVLRVGSQLLEGRWVEPPAADSTAPLRLAASPIGTAMQNATTFYLGIAVQMMLGATYVSIFPEAGSCSTVRVVELDGWRVIDARCERNVAQIVAEQAGGYSRFVLRFDTPRFSRYDLEAVDVSGTGPTDLNFAVLDTGIVAQINEREELELFSAREGREWKRRVIVDAAIDGELGLFADGGKADRLASGEGLPDEAQ